jgi:hypothetical protein
MSGLVRIPRNPEAFLDWFIENYGCGGMENYYYEQNRKILQGLFYLVSEAGLMELEFLGKVLLQLSDKSGNYLGQVIDKFDSFIEE